MQALDTKPLPKSFGFQSAGLHFRGPGAASVCDLLLDVPLSGIAVSQEKGTDRFQGDLAYVALVKKRPEELFCGSSVKMLPLAALANQVDALRNSHFVANEHFELAPGRYTLDASVLDRSTNTVSARKSVFFMPSVEPHLGISSVALMRGLRNKAEGATPEDPFLMADKEVTPHA